MSNDVRIAVFSIIQLLLSAIVLFFGDPLVAIWMALILIATRQ